VPGASAGRWRASDRQLLQFCYTSEVADSALKILDEAGLPGELRLRQGLALVAMVGRASPVTAALPPFLAAAERSAGGFTWQSEEGISLVAVLRRANGKPDSGSAPVFPRGKTHWPGAVRQRQHWFPLAGAVRP
jgi:hypothetical protein